MTTWLACVPWSSGGLLGWGGKHTNLPTNTRSHTGSMYLIRHKRRGIRKITLFIGHKHAKSRSSLMESTFMEEVLKFFFGRRNMVMDIQSQEKTCSVTRIAHGHGLARTSLQICAERIVSLEYVISKFRIIGKFGR